MTYQDEFRRVERDVYWSGPRVLLWLAAAVLGVGLLGTFACAVGLIGGVATNAASVVQKEFYPDALLRKYEWFKNGDHPQDYVSSREGFEGGKLRRFSGEYARTHEWEGAVVRYFRRPDVSDEKPCQHCGVRMHVHGWIDTKEGGHIVCPGDWVITGVQAERYPCKPDIFAATYEPVEVTRGTPEGETP